MEKGGKTVSLLTILRAIIGVRHAIAALKRHGIINFLDVV